MSDSLKLNAKIILNKEFNGRVGGYNSDEVDAFLDVIIADYKFFEKYMNDVEEIKANDFKQKSHIKELEIENAMMKERLENISSNDDVSLDNINLVKKINMLEKLCYKNGIDPSKIK